MSLVGGGGVRVGGGVIIVSVRERSVGIYRRIVVGGIGVVVFVVARRVLLWIVCRIGEVSVGGRGGVRRGIAGLGGCASDAGPEAA